MENIIVTLIFGISMFAAGWLAHAWVGAGKREPVAEEEPPSEASIPRTRWVCPQCQRRRDLPSNLDGKVLLCNNCQVRLVKEPDRA